MQTSHEDNISANSEKAYMPLIKTPTFATGQYYASAPLEGCVTHQPATGQRVSPNNDCLNIQQGVSDCPPGLEILSMNNQLLVCQKDQILEVSPGFKIRNKFTIENSSWETIYFPVEDSKFLVRDCLGTLKSSDMVILDKNRKEVIHLHRPAVYFCCIFPKCIQSMEVSAPPGNIVGTVSWEWRAVSPKFRVSNASGDVVFWIESPLFPWLRSQFTDVHFPIKSRDGIMHKGSISKLQSRFGSKDYNYKITFPLDLDVRQKAVLLGSCFVIDVMFFEETLRPTLLRYFKYCYIAMLTVFLFVAPRPILIISYMVYTFIMLITKLIL